MSVSIVTHAMRRPILAAAFLAAGLLVTATPAKAQYYPYSYPYYAYGYGYPYLPLLLPPFSRGRLRFGLGPSMGLASRLGLAHHAGWRHRHW